MENEQKTNAEIAAEIYPEVVKREEKSDNLASLRREEQRKSLLENRKKGIMGDDFSLALWAALLIFLGDILPILDFVPVVGIPTRIIGSLKLIWNIGALFFGFKAMRKHQEIRKIAPADKRAYWLGLACALIGGFYLVGLVSDFFIQIIFLILHA
ncbi:MAG: hypothetical protein Q4A27_01550 [bacterium]|nr:hypothetical protein [bacterium]